MCHNLQSEGELKCVKNESNFITLAKATRLFRPAANDRYRERFFRSGQIII